MNLNVGEICGNNKGEKNGNNNLILQASLSLWETGFTWQSTQLDLGANEYQCELKFRQYS